jgi:hypothetical protein
VSFDKTLKIYQAQVENLRVLEKAWKFQVRTLNKSLIKDQKYEVELATRQLMLLHCAYTECAFSKLIHTPYGFSPSQILQIKQTVKSNGAAEGWKKALELGLKRLITKRANKQVSDIRGKISQILERYVAAPSVLRNKVAHGQWVVAINRSGDGINPDVSQQLKDLDVVVLTRWHIAVVELCAILRLLIESPNKAFRPNYHFAIESHINKVKETTEWTLAKRVAQLKLKQQHKSLGAN